MNIRRWPAATMNCLRSAVKTVKNLKRETWIQILKTVIFFLVVIGISAVVAILFDRLISSLNLPLEQYAFLAYAIVFIITLVAHLALIAPVPIAVPIMITVAQTYNPFLTALVAALGGSIGEISTYFAGYAGRRIFGANKIAGLKRVERWIERWGAWAIAFLAFQPIIPLDIGGIVAGTVRMPLKKFVPALFIGKFPKYLIMILLGGEIIRFLLDSLFS